MFFIKQSKEAGLLAFLFGKAGPTGRIFLSGLFTGIVLGISIGGILARTLK